MAIAAGALDNTAGFIGAGGNATLTTGSLTNATAGIAQSAAKLNIDTHGAGIDNRGGKLQSLDDLTVDAGTGTLTNTGGLVLSAATTTVKAASLVNTDTRGSDQRGIGGKNVVITTTALLDNTNGVVLVNQNATLTASGQVLNNGGKAQSNDNPVINLSTDLGNNAEISANGNLT